MNKSTRKFLSFMLLLLTVSASWMGAKAQYGEAKEGEHANVNGIHFIINGFGTATVTNTQYLGEGYGYYTNTVQIPSTINVEGETYTVTGIQEKAFYRCPNLKSVQIPSTVSTIGAQAFDESNVLKITVDPTSAYFYADLNGVLYNKTQTELIFCPKTISGSFIVPEDVKTIKKFAFNGCSEITNIVMPNSLKQIEDGAFWDCSKLASANIPSSLTLLGSDAFRDAASLSSNIVLPSTLSEVGSNAFRGCTNLTHVTIEDGVGVIGSSAFKGCKALTNVNLPTSVYDLGTSAFENSGLISINIPESITEIQASTFSGCKLTNITLPEGLKIIGAQAFYNNGTTINKVEIPESVTSIATNAFNRTNVENFYINNIPSKIALNDNTPFQVTDGTKIHVFTLMKSIFENATNWSNYAGHYVADIDIVHVESIELDNTSKVVLTTKSGKLEATINPENARVKDVIFTSSNDDVITILDPSTGTFIAGAEEGSAIITCTAADGTGKSAKCEILVRKSFVPATSVTLNVTNAIMEVGNSIPVKATVGPSDATYKNVIWITTDEDVAKVENGNIIAVGPGNATLTAISGDGAARAKCSVSVSFGTYALKDPTVIDPTVEGVTNYAENEDYLVKKIIYTRDFTKTTWQALYVPFAINVEDFENDFEFARLNNVHQYEDAKGKVTSVCEFFKVRSGELKANTPYCIKAKSTGIKTIVVENTTLHKAEINPIDCASTKTKYTFYGTYTGVTGETMVSKKYYAFSNGDLGYTTSTKNSLSAYRWYMDVTSRDNDQVALGKVSFIVIDEDEEATGIENVEASTNDSIIAIYDVNGRKLNALQNGVNIVKYADGTIKKISK